MLPQTSTNHDRLPGCVLLAGMLLSAVPVLAEDESPGRPVSGAGTVMGVQFQDDFADAAGGRQTQTNGRDPIIDGNIHCLMYCYGQPSQYAPGVLKLVMTEDTASGPDGQPGVLRMEFAEMPYAVDYAGFVIFGTQQSGEITMPGWKHGKLGSEELRRTFITFRFRAENRSDPEDYSISLNFRFEPDEEASFNHGADFGTLIATQRWRTFRRPIESAKNLEAFVAAVNRSQPEHFKLVWSQNGPTHLNQPGDSLIVDDLKITME